jgi:hypothetical protein
MRVSLHREGDSVVLTPVAGKATGSGRRVVESLPILEGRLAGPEMAFRREDIYGPDARFALTRRAPVWPLSTLSCLTC